MTYWMLAIVTIIQVEVHVVLPVIRAGERYRSRILSAASPDRPSRSPACPVCGEQLDEVVRWNEPGIIGYHCSEHGDWPLAVSELSP